MTSPDLRDAPASGPLPPAVAWAGPGLGAVVATVARWRRRRAARPGARRWLRQPVVSVGNLSVGGTGKTPLAGWLARRLLADGERPAILSRGYARRDSRDGVVVVRDATAVRAALEQAGDEPLMLARSVPGCAVLVAHDRYLAGVLAESRLGCTVHLLDDGFQHHALGRDVDLVIVRPRDLADRTLPGGWLREPADAAAAADAWIVDAADGALAPDVSRLPMPPMFRLERRVDAPRWDRDAGNVGTIEAATRLVMLSGIAGPDRFEADVRAQGYAIVDHVRYPDHHPYRRADVETLAERVRRGGAMGVVTTEKDAVRLEPLAPLPFPLAVVVMRVAVTPEETFHTWVLSRIAAARRQRAGRAWRP